jgi:hypothetical protein
MEAGEPRIRSEHKTVEAQQKLRMLRFGMAAATYAVVILAAFLTMRLGLGRITTLQWVLVLAVALGGNAVFFFLFRTGRNLRFSDPSLTQAQIIFSGLWGLIPMYFLPAARPIFLMFYLFAFSFGMLRLDRRQYLKVTFVVMAGYALLLAVEFFGGRPRFSAHYEIFLFLIFGIILIWFSFFGGFLSGIRRRLGQRNAEIRTAHRVLELEMDERKRAEEEKDKLILELQEALAKIKTLSGMLPICASCKKIRNDRGYWQQIESYMNEHSEIRFSHGLCPECAKKLYPDMDLESQ